MPAAHVSATCANPPGHMGKNQLHTTSPYTWGVCAVQMCRALPDMCRWAGREVDRQVRTCPMPSPETELEVLLTHKPAPAKNLRASGMLSVASRHQRPVLATRSLEAAATVLLRKATKQTVAEHRSAVRASYLLAFLEAFILRPCPAHRLAHTGHFAAGLMLPR
jgi:hypothetical protein